MVRLGDYIEQIRGVSYKPEDLHSDLNENSIALLRANNIKDGTLNFDDVVFVDKKRVSKVQYLKKGDILVCASSGSKDLVGKAAYVSSDLPITFGAFCKVIRPKNEYPEYIGLYFQSPIYRKKISELSAGANINNIRNEHIDELQISLPNKEKQKEAVSRLNAVFEVVSQRKQQLEKLDELIKSRFVELFGGYERTVTIARYIAELRGGKSLAGTEPCKNKVLKTGAATFGWFDPEQYKYLPTDYKPLSEHKVETGDVIISRMNTPELVGACSYVFNAPDNMYYPDRLWKAVLKENTNPIFLWQLLWDRDVRKAIKEKSGGTSGTMHNISKPNLLAIKCMDAPIELQNEYANFVKQVDKSKFEVQQSLEKLETLKKSLMQKYFG